MDDKAIKIVWDYLVEHDFWTDTEVELEIYIVWKCKTLQNWKYLISTTLADGMYYEITYNGDKDEWYLDVYEKVENIVVRL